VNGELGWGGGDQVDHEVGVEADPLAVHLGASLGELSASGVVEEVDAGFGENPQRRQVDGFEFVVGHGPQRLEPHPGLGERGLFDGGRGVGPAGLATAAPPAGAGRPGHLAEPFGGGRRVVAGGEVQFAAFPRVGPGHVLVEYHAEARFGGRDDHPVFEGERGLEQFGVEAGPVTDRLQDQEVGGAGGQLDVGRRDHRTAVAVGSQQGLVDFAQGG